MSTDSLLTCLIFRRSLTTWPKKGTAVPKLCFAWNLPTKRLMVVLCLPWEKMHVRNIGLVLVSEDEASVRVQRD